MPSAPKKIFISYRRSDSQWPADRLKQALAAHVADPARDIFMDVDNIPLGVNFVEYLDGQVKQCDVLLALIGQGWLNAKRPGEERRRLDDPQDIVRTEIAIALRRGIPVIPVLLDDVEMPTAAALPDDLRELALRNGVEVRRTSFDSDAARLIRGLGLRAAQHVTPAATPRVADTTTPRTERVPKVRTRWLIAAVSIALAIAGGATWRYIGMGPSTPVDSTGTIDTATTVVSPVDSNLFLEEDAIAAWNNSNLSWCDADLMSMKWMTKIEDASVLMGAMLHRGDTVTLNALLDSVYTEAVMKANGDHVCAFDRLPFTQADAEAIAKQRQISTAEAKRAIEDEITQHGRAGLQTVKDWISAAKQ